jgi:phosphoglycolate phosphatase-like HAD superfamily hydrolase
MRIDHIVWDWNGTLFDDGDALIRATADAFLAAGLARVTPDLYRAHFTRPIADFYDRLAGRALEPAEQAALDGYFQRSYARYLVAARLAPDAVSALACWGRAGGSQSLLSLYPQDKLDRLVAAHDITAFFRRVDGLPGGGAPRKEPHLRRHLLALGVPPSRAVLVGDNVDDVHAARACEVACVLYHPAGRELTSRARATDLGAPVAATLAEAVAWVIAANGGPEQHS